MSEPQKSEGNRFKVLWLIPLLVLGYVGYVNLLPFGGTATYLIEVGGEDTVHEARITGPLDRISGRRQARGVSFRELEKDLVYFELNSAGLRKADEVGVKVRFKARFPQGGKLVLGARNKEEWSYYWRDAYVPFYRELSALPVVARTGSVVVYATAEAGSTRFSSVADFLERPPLGSTIAVSDKRLTINQQVSPEESAKLGLEGLPSPPATSRANLEGSGYSVINTALRGRHTLWTYVSKGGLRLMVVKQDLNGYTGADELEMKAYSLTGKLLGGTTVADDGNASEDQKRGPLQEGLLVIPDLEPGAYRLELKGSEDLMIRRIEANQEKLVIDRRAFLIGMNPAYFEGSPPVEPVSLYLRDFRGGEYRFYTYHASGLQKIGIRGPAFNGEVAVNQVKAWLDISLDPGAYSITLPKQDVIIESPGYFSFTPNSFFLPKRSRVVDLKYDLSWLRKDVDYIVVDYGAYEPPAEDGGWLVASASWKVRELFAKDDKLSFAFNVPHLTKEEYSQSTIPIDWIEITLKVAPIWERMGWGD